MWFAEPLHPDYEATWQKLRDISKHQRALIDTQLPNGASLSQDTARDAVSAWLEEGAPIALLGPSGCGKSALARSVCEKWSKVGEAVWLEAEQAAALITETLDSRQIPLEDTLNVVTTDRALLVIDAIDHLGESATQRIRQLLSAIRYPDSPWRVLVTCQAELWSSLALSVRSEHTGAEDFHVISVTEAVIHGARQTEGMHSRKSALVAPLLCVLSGRYREAS